MSKLEDLLVDERALDRDALGTALLTIVAVSKDGTLRPMPAWRSLSKTQRVLATLLGVKAAHVLGVRPQEALAALEIAELSGVPGNTSRPVLRGLLSRGLVAQDSEGRYLVPNMAVPDAIAVLPEA